MLWNNANLSLNVAFFRNDPHATSTARWRLKTFPCGIPTCVTPRETSHSSKEPCNKVKSCFFFDRRGVFATASQGRSRRRSAHPTGNRPGTHRPRVSPSPSPSPRGPRGALPKSKISSQFRRSPLRFWLAEQGYVKPAV